MRALKRHSRGVRTLPVLDSEPGTTEFREDGAADEAAESFDFDEEVHGIFRVHCPDCARPIALLADEQVLPEHALCPSPWNPFGLTVCAGSGRSVAEATPLGADEGAGRDVTVLLTLPAGLDWRTQPFSHISEATSRPLRLSA